MSAPVVVLVLFAALLHAGWNTLLRMSGNSSAVTERSFGVPDGVNNGQFGAGPVIDFFGLSSKYSKFPVEFVYPSETAIVPANIALIDEGRAVEAPLTLDDLKDGFFVGNIVRGLIPARLA